MNNLSIRAREEATCARKIRYSEKAAKDLEIKSKYLLRAYRCSVCYGFHCTSMATARTVKIYR